MASHSGRGAQRQGPGLGGWPLQAPGQPAGRQPFGQLQAGATVPQPGLPPAAQPAGGGGGEGRLRSVDELPPPFRAVFAPRFRWFNAIQNDCFNAVYGSSANVICAAPTGGGKTVLLELAVLQALARHLEAGGTRFVHRPGHLKALYVAPSRALVQEKVRDWGERFGGALGLSVQEVTGGCCTAARARPGSCLPCPVCSFRAASSGRATRLRPCRRHPQATPTRRAWPASTAPTSSAPRPRSLTR